jgi:hypothetical protein
MQINLFDRKQKFIDNQGQSIFFGGQGKPEKAPCLNNYSLMRFVLICSYQIFTKDY